MPAIGVRLSKWTAFLLLCSIPTSAYSHSTNDTAIVGPAATAASSTTTAHATSTPSPSRTAAYPRHDANATCPFRTINYITHTLPQQCAKTSWSAPLVPSTQGTPAEAEATPSTQTSHDGGAENGIPEDKGSETHATPPQAGDAVSAESTIGEEAENELETDSPLDNANFLSFEEWKMKNLAQVGQSPENVGQGRAAPNQPDRRRPVNVNALDSLGEEAEIELDFSGFGPPVDGPSSANLHAGASSTTEDEKKVAPTSWALSKDAGKTCKERFNYASFDCAATVLKTNKQAKSATSVLVENKDSYMLNECSANNKFFIVELCDDILVDTVVLANYEFFSSMFRHFRVSVSDRYPVKMERWRTLATFEARNSRDIQPFLITEPQIWARYLRIEFLTQYGNEFYCPLSLLRVHGTTMMEQFRREEEEARGVDDDVDLETTEDNVIKPAIDSGPIPPEDVPIVEKDAGEGTDASTASVAEEPAPPSSGQDGTNGAKQGASERETSIASAVETQTSQSNEVPGHVESTPTTNVPSDATAPPAKPDTNNEQEKAILGLNSTSAPASTPTEKANIVTGTQTAVSDSEKISPIIATTQSKSVSIHNLNDTAPSPKSQAPKPPSNNTAASGQSSPQQRSTATQPSAPVPSTQESFYKSIHKRLLHLEANSTLSLQYIEEQSRILRDAFVKVEKRQLAKTEKFLDHLNSTVMQELRSFRNLYDQLWQSTVIELESMKERQNTEMNEIGTRLSLMADELVWQKRMAVVQSTLLLLCLGLVLFVRSGTLGSTADVPIVQQLGSKYTSLFESSPPRSPPESGTARRRRTFKNMWRSDTSAGLSDRDPPSDAETDGARSPQNIQYSPPTPDSLAHRPLVNGAHASSPSPSPNEPHTNPLDDQAKRLEVLETQSGPATPNGTRDSRPSWEEVDRAIDLLKAEEGDKHPVPLSKGKRERERKTKRSPLRRAQSSFDAAGDSAPDDHGDGLFLG